MVIYLSAYIDQWNGTMTYEPAHDLLIKLEYHKYCKCWVISHLSCLMQVNIVLPLIRLSICASVHHAFLVRAITKQNHGDIDFLQTSQRECTMYMIHVTSLCCLFLLNVCQTNITDLKLLMVYSGLLATIMSQQQPLSLAKKIHQVILVVAVKVLEKENQLKEAQRKIQNQAPQPFIFEGFKF